MSHIVICTKCGQKFDRDKVPFVESGKRRYAHEVCPALDPAQEKNKEELIKLEEYIKELFKEEYVNPRVRKQINQFVEQNNYTYSGILKTLIYAFEIKNMSLEKSRGGIGIVPYLYKEAYQYYFDIYKAKKQNQNKKIMDYAPSLIKITVAPPKKTPIRRKKTSFTFLDEEEK